MPDYQALSKGDRAKTDAVLRITHHRRVDLEVYRKSPAGGEVRPVFSYTNRFLGGSVNGNEAETPVTVLECDLLDVDRRMDWENGEHRKFEVRVVDHVFVPALNDWVSAPCFHGPMWSFTRDGDVVHLKAGGVEYNAQGSVRRPFHRPPDSKATVVASHLLADAGAQKRDMKIPNRKTRLPRSVTVGVEVRKDNPKTKRDESRKAQRLVVDRDDTYMGEAKRILNALDLDVYGDGRGRICATTPKSRATESFTERQMVAPVTSERGGDDEQPNTWLVQGAKPKGDRDRANARAELPNKHPASAFAQRWNGQRREVSRSSESKHIKTDKQAKRLANRLRDRALRETTRYSVSVFPCVLGWRPFTMASFPTGGGRTSARVPSWTYPLGPGADPLTLGSTKARGWHK